MSRKEEKPSIEQSLVLLEKDPETGKSLIDAGTKDLADQIMQSAEAAASDLSAILHDSSLEEQLVPLKRSLEEGLKMLNSQRESISAEIISFKKTAAEAASISPTAVAGVLYSSLKAGVGIGIKAAGGAGAVPGLAIGGMAASYIILSKVFVAGSTMRVGAELLKLSQENARDAITFQQSVIRSVDAAIAAKTSKIEAAIRAKADIFKTGIEASRELRKAQIAADASVKKTQICAIYTASAVLTAALAVGIGLFAYSKSNRDSEFMPNGGFGYPPAPF